MQHERPRRVKQSGFEHSQCQYLGPENADKAKNVWLAAGYIHVSRDESNMTSHNAGDFLGNARPHKTASSHPHWWRALMEKVIVRTTAANATSCNQLSMLSLVHRHVGAMVTRPNRSMIQTAPLACTSEAMVILVH